jgi:DNA-binding transcriptional regulator GbsR (MarR family)
MKNDKKTLAEERFEAIERRLVEILADFGYLKGRSAKTAEVTAYIYIREEVTQQLLRELTGYSLGTISAALQDLETLGVASKYTSPDARGYVYRLAGTPSQVLSRSMTDVQEYLSQISGLLEEIEAKMSKTRLSQKHGYSSIKRFLDEMNVLVPAYEHVLQRFQTAPPTDTKKQAGETNRG